jgi:hypothetical protein
MKAKLVHLTERQFEYLHDKAGELGISVSELIRRILDENMDGGKAPPTRSAESASRRKG